MCWCCSVVCSVQAVSPTPHPCALVWVAGVERGNKMKTTFLHSFGPFKFRWKITLNYIRQSKLTDSLEVNFKVCAFFPPHFFELCPNL